jgi:DNA primase
MTDPWLTYTQAAEKLGVSRQAVRQKATRGRWPRTRGNDEQARIQVPEQPYRSRTVTVPVPDDQLVGSLREHIATLKAELAIERERADRATAELKGQLVTERERGDRIAAELAGERTARQSDQEQLAAARAAAGKATAELVELARRLAAIAETQTSAEPEPPRHWAIRAWRWMQKTA